MTVMFTHKAAGAWDALAGGLIEAGFTITASWPINTEAEGSLHIREKSAARSTIFLVCRVREADSANAEARYWEEVEPTVRQAVRAESEGVSRSWRSAASTCISPVSGRHFRYSQKRGRSRAERRGRSRRQSKKTCLRSSTRIRSGRKTRSKQQGER
jgi:putative DNA methylase